MTKFRVDNVQFIDVFIDIDLYEVYDEEEEDEE